MAAIAESHSAEHSNFDAAQGGIFEARFDNELLGANSTVGADRPFSSALRGKADITMKLVHRR